MISNLVIDVAYNLWLSCIRRVADVVSDQVVIIRRVTDVVLVSDQVVIIRRRVADVVLVSDQIVIIRRRVTDVVLVSDQVVIHSVGLGLCVWVPL